MANLNTRQTEQVREHIQGSMLTKMLNEYALTGKFNGAKVDASRIRAAEVLLRKILPDLKATELTGADGKALAVNVIRYADHPE